MSARSLVLFTLAALAVAATALPASASAQAAGVPDDVDATYVVTFDALDRVTLTAEAHVHRTLINGEVYTVEEIRREYAQYGALGFQSEADAFVDRMLERVHAKAEKDLAAAFPDALSRGVGAIDLDRSTLSRSSPSPTIDLTLTATVALDRVALGLGGYSDEDVDAVFRAGARLLTDVHLAADAGYRVTYVVHAPGALAWDDGGLARVVDDGRTLTAEVDNKGQPTRVVTTTSAWLAHPDHAPPEREDVRTTVTYAIPDLALSNGALTVDAHVETRIHALDLAARLPATLPERVDLTFVTAGALRDLLAEGVVSAAEVTESEQALLAEMEDAVGARFDGLASLTGGFDAASLAADAAPGAPLSFTADATAAYALPAAADLAEGADLAALLAAGARLVADIPLSAEAGSATTIRLELPASVVVTDAGSADDAAGTVDATGRAVTWVVDNSAGTERVERAAPVTLAGEDAVVATAPDATLDVFIDVTDVDVSVTDAAGGDFGRLLVDVSFTGELNAIALPETARAALPPGLTLEHVTADGLRALVAEGFLTEADVASVEADVLGEVRVRLADALGVPADVTGGLDRATLARAAAGSLGSDPVLFRARSVLAIPLGGNGDGDVQAHAVALTVLEREFAFPPIDGLDATYTLLLPRGISIEDARVDGGSVETGREDGRDWLRVTPEGGESALTMVAMGVTGTFVVVKFWPVLVAAGGLLVLLVAGAAAARGRRKRRS